MELSPDVSGLGSAQNEQIMDEKGYSTMARNLISLFVCSHDLVMKALFPTSDGTYALGFEVNLATPVQLRRRDLLAAIPHCSDAEGDLGVTQETVCSHFNLSDWDPNSLICNADQLGTVSDLLPSSRKHMPVYFIDSNDVLAGVWEPDQGLVRWLKDLSEEDRCFYRRVFANTKRIVA